MSKYVVLGAVVLSMLGCNNRPTVFKEILSTHSGVQFNNELIESDTLNILDYEYMYNGGGVGIGDFNNDDLLDIVFTGNLVSNELYINKGNFQFENISHNVGFNQENLWSHGVSIVDINNDGWDDIYISNSKSENAENRKNKLYINLGEVDGAIKFKESSEAYGLADDSYTLNSAFFDYDNDGDLDVIMIVNEMGNTRNPGKYNNKQVQKTYQRVDRLYRNDFDETKGHPVFTDVSDEAGIIFPGFSLGVNINDINKDGYKDIYITNDFLSDDLMYINQGDGTFMNQAEQYLKHSSYSAMGNDVVDINNDGYDDIIAVDMLPEDNYRQKRILGPTNYNFYLNNDKFGYSYQFVRNTLQLNPGIEPSNVDIFKFQDVALQSGISATDWSWTPLVADYDLDGLRDIIITNGFPKDVTDRDYTDYKADAFAFAPKEVLLSKIPSVKISNYVYHNQGDAVFSNVTQDWGFERATFSNGAAYADLDNDGDLDVIINNINDKASIYENTIQGNNYLKVQLTGPAHNKDAIGARIVVDLGESIMEVECSPYRGYLSSNSKIYSFGLGTLDEIKQIKIIWPDQSYTTLENIAANQLLTIDYSTSASTSYKNIKGNSTTLFKRDSNFKVPHLEWDYIDYNIQPLLPHKLSQLGPGMSVADFNNDGLDDLYLSGSAYMRSSILYQKEDGSFLLDSIESLNIKPEEMGVLFFDMDGDEDKDIYIATGSYEFEADDSVQQDIILKQEDGRFIETQGLPSMMTSSSKATAADFDRDGDLDVFVAGRVIPQLYPKYADSHLLKNVSKNDNISFEKYQEALFENVGLISDALWTDYNGDNWLDLILVGELQEIQFFKNHEGELKKDKDLGLHGIYGFWNSIESVDIDLDGDMDYIIGNRGTNNFNKISAEYPYRIYVKDFDQNGSIDAVPSAYFLDQEGGYSEYPTCSRMDMAKELNATRKMYPSYHEYGQLKITKLFKDSTRQNSEIYQVNKVESVVLLNVEGQFSMIDLPKEAQIAPVFGMQAEDFDGDGAIDLLLVGNDYGNELIHGRLDALNGLLLKGHGNGKFEAIPNRLSGFNVPGDGKSLVKLKTLGGYSFIAAENMGQYRKFDLSDDRKSLSLLENEWQVTFDNGKRTWSQEYVIGDSYLGQSTRWITIPEEIESISIKDYEGNTRIINAKN